MVTVSNRARMEEETREAGGQSSSACVSDNSARRSHSHHLKVDQLLPCPRGHRIPTLQGRPWQPAAHLPEQREKETSGHTTSGQRSPGGHWWKVCKS